MYPLAVRALGPLLLAAYLCVAGCGARYGDPYHRESGAARADSSAAHRDSGGYLAPYRDLEHDPTHQAVVARARVALNCSAVLANPIAAGGWLASGCGLEQSYTCVGRGRDLVCMPEAPPRPVRLGASTGTRAAPTRPLDAADLQLAMSALVGCPRSDADGTIVLTLGQAGEVQRVETPGLSTATATCVVQALRLAHFAVRSMAEQRSIPVRSSEDFAADTTSTAHGESAARAFIDGMRSAILGCTGGTTTAVVISWTAQGALSLRLPDARAGTTEDTCVRAAAPGAQLIPAPGEAGSVVHVVQ